MPDETTYVVQRLQRGSEPRLWEEMGWITVPAGTFARTALLEALRVAGVKDVTTLDLFHVLGPDGAREFSLHEEERTPDYKVVEVSR